MKAPNLILRCYSKQAHGQHVAVCIDLCLASQADTPGEARAKLEQQVWSYIEEALTIDRDSAAELLSRKAPLSQRAEYWLIRIASKAHLLQSGIRQVFNTILPVHVGPSCHA